MATKLATNELSLEVARHLKDSFSSNSYYMFVGNPQPVLNAIPALYDYNKDTLVHAYKNMIQGKKVANTDIALMIRNVPYESNTVYTMYDDEDLDLLTSDFFVIVDEGSYFHVYKCLDNNRGANSTNQPDFSHITGSNTILYQTADGYRWKYMYSVSSADKLKFATSEYFPVVVNSSVVANSRMGAIDIIKVEGTGEGYDNYVTGTFQSSHLRVGGNTLIYQIANNSTNPANGFYTGCIMYIASGTGQGQYETVADYFSNSSGNYAVLANTFAIAPLNGATYQVYPEVVIKGSGYQTTNARARALVNSLASNSVYRVEILERGANYDYVYSANVIANGAVGVPSVAELRAIHGPRNGHGYDAASELGSNKICVYSKFSNNESNTISIDNDFSQLGLIVDPLFCNVAIETANQVGVFIIGEKAKQITYTRLNVNCSMNTTSKVLLYSSGDFVYQVAANDQIILTDASWSNIQLATINSITNSSHLYLTVNGFFNCTDIHMYKVEVTGEAYVKSTNGTHIVLTNCTPTLTQNELLVGNDSSAICYINAISRGGIAKEFNTFVQLYKYEGEIVSGTFQEDEIVFQGNLTTSNALLHSYVLDGANITLYTSNQTGSFAINNTITGNTSGARASITTKYSPEIISGTGKVLFLENIEAISRSSNTSETFQLILNFKE